MEIRFKIHVNKIPLNFIKYKIQNMRTKYKNGSRSIASTSTPLRFGLVPTSSFG